MTTPQDSETRRFGRSAALLSAGVGLAGLLTYIYFSLASHSLPADEYGEVVLLWSITFVTISVLYRPVEQLLARSIAEREAQGLPIGQAIRTAALLQGGVAVACLVVTLLLRGPITDELLSGNDTLYWILVATTVAFAVSFFARGYLAGRRRFPVLAALLVAESAARASFALAVAVGIASGQTAVALGIAAAPALSLLVVPLASRRVGSTANDSPELIEPPDFLTPEPVPSERETAAQRAKAPLAFAGSVFVVMLCEQTMLNAGPLIIGGTEGAAIAGFVFNMLLVARAPLVVFQGVSTSLLPHLTRLLTGTAGEGDTAGRDEFRTSVRATLLGVAAFTLAVVLVLAAFGPLLMDLAFGGSFEYHRIDLVVVGVGMGLYLTATTLNQACLAQGRARGAAICWAIAAVAFLVWVLAAPLGAVDSVLTGFTGAAAVLALLLSRVFVRR